MKLIDVSHWQREIDFTKVKESGVEGVIIKAGGSDDGFYTDSYFERNYKIAKEVGLYVGAYYYAGSKFLGEEAGLNDARKFLNIIEGKQFELPIYIDIEGQPRNMNEEVTEATISFCDYLEQNGYYVGVYASDISGFKERLILDKVRRFTLWVARYGSKPQYVENYGIWQYSSTGRIAGINGNVDLDECFIDFPSIIKEGKFNNCNSETEIEVPVSQNSNELTEDEIYIVKPGDTLSVIACKYGTTYKKLAEYNNIENPNLIFPNQVIKIPNKNIENYTIQYGDTLTSIANKFNTSIDKLVELNNIKDPNLIYAGDTIRIR